MNKRFIVIRRDHHQQLTKTLEKLTASSRTSAFDRLHLDELRRALKRARVVDQLPDKPQSVTVGSTVRVMNLYSLEKFVYTLVMPDQANLEEGRLSVTDPLGAAILGYREGDLIRIAPQTDDFTVKIVDIIDHPIQVVAGPGKQFIPMLYSRVTGCPTDLIEFYVSLFSGRREAQVLPHHLGNLDLDPADFTQSMEAFLDGVSEQSECPVMLIEWQWHVNMPKLIGLLHRRKQEALFVKSSNSQPIRRVTALISGSRHALQNLEIAMAIARQLRVEASAIRVVNPEWIGLEGDQMKENYLGGIKRVTEAHLRRIGLVVPVQVLFSADMVEEVVRSAEPNELLVMGCPNDLLLYEGFMESTAGEILRRFAGTVIMRLPGEDPESNTDLSDVFWEATIVKDLEASDKWGAIEQLVDALTRAGQIPLERRDQILQAIQMRELDGTTAVGGGVAMPHAAIDDFNGLVGCLGISPKGIIYEEGAEPVHFLFLLVSSSRDYSKYHQVQSAIARFMTRKAELRRSRLLRCQTPAEAAVLLSAKRT